MKAKEYLTKFEVDCWDTDEKTATYNLAVGYLEEVYKIAKVRKARKPEAIKSIFRELNQKWNAMCKLDKGKRFRPNGFIKLAMERTKEIPEFIGIMLDLAREFRGES